MLNTIMDLIFTLFTLSIFCRLVAEIMLKNETNNTAWYQQAINLLISISYYPGGYLLEQTRNRFPRYTNVQMFGCHFDMAPVMLIAAVHLFRILSVFSGSILAQLFLFVFAS